MAKRKWYVVTVGRDIGVFPTWLEVAPLVKGVPNAIHQSFLTRAEAMRMFADEQARGRTRTVDPELGIMPAVNQPQRARNYSAPTPRPPATSTFSLAPMHQGHHRSPTSLSVHPTTTSSRNRTSDGTPSPISHRAPIASGSALGSSPASASSGSSMSRFQIIQAALDQELGSRPVTPVRVQGQVPLAGGRTPLFPSSDRSGSHSLTPRAGSSRTRPPLQKAATAEPDMFWSPKTYAPGASSSKNRQSASLSPGFEARAPYASNGHPSHTNANARAKPNKTTGARTPNPTAEPYSRSSRGLERGSPLRSNVQHSSSRMTASDSPEPSYASPRAVIRTPDWLPPYPTTRTPSPDSDPSPELRPSSGDELLSPLSNVNLNTFSLDSHANTTVESNTSGPSVNNSSRHSTSKRSNRHSPSVSLNGTSRQTTLTSASTGDASIVIQGRIEITHDSDPRSPILSQHQVPELAYESVFELSFARPSPRFNDRPLTSSPLSNLSVQDSSLLLRPGVR